MTKHRFETRRCLSRPVCVSCGLVKLRNRFTDWCIRNGCEHAEHPDYEKMRRSSGRGLTRNR